jgi:hypothetical protein
MSKEKNIVEKEREEETIKQNSSSILRTVNKKYELFII